MKVLLTHPGTQHSRHLARELAKRQLLSAFCTTLGFGQGPGASLLSVLQKLPRMSGLGSRIITGVPGRQVTSRPLIELKAFWNLRNGHDALKVFHQRNEQFQSCIAKKTIEESDAVIGFDTSSWILARRCNQLSMPFYLDRTIAHRSTLNRIMSGFAEQYPDWLPSIPSEASFVVDAEQEEHERAKRIVVGGKFARDTLVSEGIDQRKIIVNPYGVDWNQFAIADRRSVKRPFRFLFVGSVTARKGIPILLDAWRKMQPAKAELWIAGSIGPRERKLIPDLPGLRMLNQIPHSQMASIYAECDVFVLPSLFEGFGLVILEALAAGLPVISTTNTGAIDAIVDERLGKVIPIAEVSSLVEAMNKYLEERPDRDLVMDEARKLKQQFSWEAYGDRWQRLLMGDFGLQAAC